MSVECEGVKHERLPRHALLAGQAQLGASVVEGVHTQVVSLGTHVFVGAHFFTLQRVQIPAFVFRINTCCFIALEL